MTDTVVTIEDASKSSDVDITGSDIDSQFILATGLISTGNPLDKTRVIEVQLEYEADEGQELFFEYSQDAGVNWTAYSSVDIEETEGPKILSVRKVITGHNLQLRIVSDTVGMVRILSFVPRVVKEARVWG